MKSPIKHTKGPWRADFNAHNLPIGICSADGRHVTDVKSYGEAPDTDRANARLIAAAPEMLEALKAIASMTRPETLAMTQWEYAKLCVSVNDLAKSAIAQATE